MFLSDLRPFKVIKIALPDIYRNTGGSLRKSSAGKSENILTTPLTLTGNL